MDLDLFFACTSGAENLPNRVFRNNGSGVFTEVNGAGVAGITGASIANGAGNSDSAVSADYNNDGFMDVAVSNGIATQPVRLGGPHQLFKNSGNGNRWIQIELQGTASRGDVAQRYRRNLQQREFKLDLPDHRRFRYCDGQSGCRCQFAGRAGG